MLSKVHQNIDPLQSTNLSCFKLEVSRCVRDDGVTRCKFAKLPWLL